MRSRLLLCMLGAVTLVAACGGDDDDATSTSTGAATATTMDPNMDMSTTAPATAPGTTTPAAGTAGGELPMEVTIDIKDFAFGPEQVHVAVGATITWTNSDDQAHTATASGTFDTGSIAAGESASVTVDEAGTFDYICGFHPFMTGQVVVG